MFTENDLKLYRIFKRVSTKAKVEVEGGAVRSIAFSYEWFDNLEKLIIDDVNSQQKKTKKKAKK